MKLRSDTAVVGASAGLLAWFGYSATLFPRGSISLFFIPMPNILALTVLSGVSAYAMYASPAAMDDLAHAGHFAGLLTGVAAGFVTRGRSVRHMH